MPNGIKMENGPFGLSFGHSGQKDIKTHGITGKRSEDFDKRGVRFMRMNKKYTCQDG